MNRAPLTLLDLNQKIKSVIKNSLDSYWIIAEISEISVNYSGHCYMEFIQKEEDSEKIISRARATIWSNVFRMIKPYFETTTGRALSEGISIMVRVNVEFHPVYGLSLNILDIEPTYTVGEVALRRQKILEKLANEGVLEMNKELELPVLPGRLAVISSLTAAGYEDFVNQLETNPQCFKFYYKLFPAVMQGNEAEKSIINQLDKIFQHADKFDAVIIIRGGGAQADLDCFNNYWLAYHITQFPLPVITGIGHEQDDSVVDIVAHTRLKTPTAVAEFLIDCFDQNYENLLSVQQDIVEVCRKIVDEKKFGLLKNVHHFQNTLKEALNIENRRINTLQSQYIAGVKEMVYLNHKQIIKTGNELKYLCATQIEKNKNQIIAGKNMLHIKLLSFVKQHQFNLTLKENIIKLNSPDEILRKGYSITIHNGNVVKDGTKLREGDEIETRFYKGKRKSIISK